MKRPYPDTKRFNKSTSCIPSSKALSNYEYALWEAGFECAVRLMIKINKPTSKGTKAHRDNLIKKG